jgi:heme iron utilization protein
VAAGRTGSLSTTSVEPAGYPFGSVVSYAPDGAGRPVLWLSDLAEHSRNLAADPRASLLAVESGGTDPLALGRVTLLGRVAVLEGTERDAALEVYRGAHPGSYTQDFHGFRMYRLDVAAVRYVGGFARMSWVDAADYAAAEPDPLRPHARRVVEHMNDDHADALVAYCRVFGGRPGTVAARMTGVDRYGFGVLADGRDEVRIAFAHPVATPDEVRAAMIDLLHDARSAGG